MAKMRPVKAWAVLVSDDACNKWRLSNGAMIYPTKREALGDAIKGVERVARIEIWEGEK